MAYEIVNRLKNKNEHSLLQKLSAGVEAKRKENNKQHEVWELSFDWKDCRSNEFCWQKLHYMHCNPCTGRWQLASSSVEYAHSSAKYYITGEQGIYPVTNFMEMEDLDFDNNGK
ncbi:MAG: hypothetical protein QM791_16835 [Ferruginibacter sp.]